MWLCALEEPSSAISDRDIFPSNFRHITAVQSGEQYKVSLSLITTEVKGQIVSEGDLFNTVEIWHLQTPAVLQLNHFQVSWHLLLWKQILLQLCDGGRGWRQLGKGHDVLQGDVCLGAGVWDLGVSGGAEQFGVRGPAQDLDHDGLLGGAESFHRLIVGGLREVLAIDLREEAEKNKIM